MLQTYLPFATETYLLVYFIGMFHADLSWRQYGIGEINSLVSLSDLSSLPRWLSRGFVATETRRLLSPSVLNTMSSVRARIHWYIVCTCTSFLLFLPKVSEMRIGLLVMSQKRPQKWSPSIWMVFLGWGGHAPKPLKLIASSVVSETSATPACYNHEARIYVHFLLYVSFT